MQTGHGAIDCKDNRALDNSKVPLVSPEVAWEKLKAANEERDLDDIRDVRNQRPCLTSIDPLTSTGCQNLRQSNT